MPCMWFRVFASAAVIVLRFVPLKSLLGGGPFCRCMTVNPRRRQLCSCLTFHLVSFCFRLFLRSLISLLLYCFGCISPSECRLVVEDILIVIKHAASPGGVRRGGGRIHCPLEGWSCRLLPYLLHVCMFVCFGVMKWMAIP